jgi:hypothetical protein
MEREHLEIKAMVARVHAETAAALAAEEAEVHETCAHCGHTKIYFKVAGSARLVPKADRDNK